MYCLHISMQKVCSRTKKHMESEKIEGGASSQEAAYRAPYVATTLPGPKTAKNMMKTPIALRKLGEWIEEGEFEGFEEEKSNMSRIVMVEKGIKCLRQLIAGILDSQDHLTEEN